MIEAHEEDNDFVELNKDIIEARIVHFLTVYPRLSPSMLQVGIGTAISPRMWRPVLEQMLSDGKIIQYNYPVRSPSGRDLTHKIICLKENAPEVK